MFRCVCVSVRVRAAVCPDIFLRLDPLPEGNVADSPGVESVRACVCVMGGCVYHVHGEVYQCVSVCPCVCVTDVMFELTQTVKPNHDTHTHTHTPMYMGVCVCVFKCKKKKKSDTAGKVALAG